MDAEQWNERYDTKELMWSVEPNQFLPPEVKGLKPGQVLDMACGEGRNAIWLAEQGWQATAMDFSSVAVDKGRQLAESKEVSVDWVVGDATDCQDSDAGYDLVIMFYLQIPEPKMSAALGCARAAVKPGGSFLLVAHDLSNLEAGYGGPSDAAVLPTPESVVACLDGFDIEKAEVIERRVEVEGETRIALDTLVRAHRSID
ncbi:MAG: class I SAM-dependent methyltransferase [Acidimicrobiales bacterium]